MKESRMVRVGDRIKIKADDLKLITARVSDNYDLNIRTLLLGQTEKQKIRTLGNKTFNVISLSKSLIKLEDASGEVFKLRRDHLKRKKNYSMLLVA